MQTIQMLLCASEEARQHLWLITIVYTLLVNQLSQEVSAHNDFQSWQTQGFVSQKAVQAICKKLKKTEEFSGLPARIYTSAVLMVSFTFKSWFAIHKKRQQKLDGKRRWLQMTLEALALAESMNFSAETVRARATEILLEIQAQLEKRAAKQQESGELEQQSQTAQASVMSLLFQAYDQRQEPLDRIAIAYLLRNDCKVNEEEEDPDKLALRLEKKKIEIQRLEKQMASQLPTGRDPTGDRTQQCIDEAIAFAEHTTLIPANFWLQWHRTLLTRQSAHGISVQLWALGYLYDRLNDDAEFEAWERDLPRRLAKLSTKFEALPYPFIFGGADVYWSREADVPSNTVKASSSRQTAPSTVDVQKQRKRKRCRTRRRQKKLTGRFCVRFKGKGLSHLRFRVYCDRRQQPIINQFVTDDEELKARDKDNKFSLGLGALRSAHLLWEEDRQQLHTKQHWKLQNLWLKWFCALSNGTAMRDSELDLWFTSLFYLALSKSIPWQTHRSYLHCTIDPRLLTAEGTEAVRQEKLAKTLERLAQVEKNVKLVEQQTEQQAHEDGETLATAGEMEQLDEEQDEESVAQQGKHRQTAVKRLNSTRTRLGNASPSRPPRQTISQQQDIAVGVCFSREKVLGVAVVDTRSQAVLDFCNLRSLLTDDRLALLTKRAAKIPASRKGKRSVRQLQLKDYRLFNRWRRLRHQNLTQRGDQQRHGLYAESHEESNLAQHLKRVIAKKLLQMAQQWQASRITLPDFGNLRESVECEIQARARRKFPDDNVKLQKQYAKELRMSHHRWNHKQLAQSIRACAAQTGVPVMTATQPKEGELRDKAVALTLAR
ncbi:hypothetical protein H6F86_29305 [Phormidium sp. FACHB-592]|uniref:Type V CRISPR-associated protein Cas12k n=1 Tax=Stenomitos frigidus AS-A4 TaxID=2933935 RepID=A0ABV0KQY1_9CYAN|nr:type V CRISPR-associated protein Cas12k [Phormidium sp. FACHB-592]MBD2077912.1 hypothetical protein [Phormidium sp. FACHB-592]